MCVLSPVWRRRLEAEPCCASFYPTICFFPSSPVLKLYIRICLIYMLLVDISFFFFFFSLMSSVSGRNFYQKVSKCHPKPEVLVLQYPTLIMRFLSLKSSVAPCPLENEMQTPSDAWKSLQPPALSHRPTNLSYLVSHSWHTKIFNIPTLKKSFTLLRMPSSFPSWWIFPIHYSAYMFPASLGPLTECVVILRWNFSTISNRSWAVENPELSLNLVILVCFYH